MALSKFTAVSPDPLLENASRAGAYGEAQKARLVHVNNVITFLQAAATEEHADNAAAITAGLVVGDFYHTAGFLKVVI
jgi:hypothetical protein